MPTPRVGPNGASEKHPEKRHCINDKLKAKKTKL